VKTIEVWIEGVSPLLIHKFGDQAQADSGKSTRRVQITTELPRDIAEKGTHRDSKGGLCIAGTGISRAIAEMGAGHKQRGSRKSLKYLVPAACVVCEDMVPLYLKDRKTRAKDFEVDSRAVVIPATKGRVMRHRARLDEWSAKFNLRLRTEILDEATIRLLLEEAGIGNGLGDYRVQRGGPFGIFAVVCWDGDLAKKAA